MTLSVKQIQALRRNVDSRHVRRREVNGRELCYVEGWFAISEANRIFGFDGWNRETVESRCVLSRESRGNFLVVYIAKVRITVHANGPTIVREGHGTGEGRGTSPGEAHELALKVAETDATKRALATFGKPFGLALYANVKLPPATTRTAKHTTCVQATSERSPRDVIQVHQPKENRRAADAASPQHPKNLSNQSHPADGVRATTAVPEVANDAPLGLIDKSVLTFGTPNRLRNKAHLRFVATQPCLICGRQPSDPHHLRFAQPRALGLKVSDEFTVPLCRGHHRELHQAGKEAAWWEDLEIDALAIAKGLWDESHARPNIVTSASQSDKTAARALK